MRKYITLLAMTWSLLVSSNVYAQSCLQLFSSEPAQKAISVEQLGEIERLLREFADQRAKSRIQFGANKTARAYALLAEQNVLINQLDSRLYQRGIIRQNGGLCGTACAVNAMAALYEIPAAEFNEFAPTYMQSFVEFYTSQTKLDARMGTYLHIQQETLSMYFSAAETILPMLGIKVPHIAPRLISHDESTISSALQSNSLVIGSIKPAQNEFSYGAHRSHAIIILKLDTINKKIYISDPNRPNLIWAENYVVRSDGNVYTYAQATYGQQLVQLYGTLLLSKE